MEFVDHTKEMGAIAMAKRPLAFDSATWPNAVGVVSLALLGKSYVASVRPGVARYFRHLQAFVYKEGS